MSFMTTEIELALVELKNSGLLAIPTETVYGLAAPINNEKALGKIFNLKQRPHDHPLIVHVAGIDQLEQVASDIPDYVYTLAEHFWPGPLSFVLNKNPNLSDQITAGQKTVAVRCPAHPLSLELIRCLGVPLAAPSANRFGQLSPTTAEHVQQSFINESLMILDGGRCELGIESTILEATSEFAYRVLREGPVTKQHIEQVFSLKEANFSQPIKTPGSLLNHYQPIKPLHLFSTRQQFEKWSRFYKDEIYVLCFSDLSYVELFPRFKFPACPKKSAYELYYQLRLADQKKVKAIIFETPPPGISWAALRDRVEKAATKY